MANLVLSGGLQGLGDLFDGHFASLSSARRARGFAFPALSVSPPIAQSPLPGGIGLNDANSVSICRSTRPSLACTSPTRLLTVAISARTGADSARISFLEASICFSRPRWLIHAP